MDTEEVDVHVAKRHRYELDQLQRHTNKRTILLPVICIPY